MAAQERYNLPDAIFGRTYLALEFTILKNSVAVDLTGATIILHIENKKAPRSYDWTTDNGELEITDDVNGVFQITQKTISIPVGNYGYGIVFYLADNTIFEYVYGNLNVLDLTPNGG
jgi:hypothetical protein